MLFVRQLILAAVARHPKVLGIVWILQESSTRWVFHWYVLVQFAFEASSVSEFKAAGDLNTVQLNRESARMTRRNQLDTSQSPRKAGLPSHNRFHHGCVLSLTAHTST